MRGISNWNCLVILVIDISAQYPMADIFVCSLVCVPRNRRREPRTGAKNFSERFIWIRTEYQSHVRMNYYSFHSSMFSSINNSRCAKGMRVIIKIKWIELVFQIEQTDRTSGLPNLVSSLQLLCLFEFPTSVKRSEATAKDSDCRISPLLLLEE